jgi:hypothetical protein
MLQMAMLGSNKLPSSSTYLVGVVMPQTFQDLMRISLVVVGLAQRTWHGGGPDTLYV